MKKYSLILLAVALFCSCTTTRYTARTTEIQQTPIMTTGLVVDVRPDFTHRVSATSRPNRSLEMAKKEALYRAIVEHNVDVVVDPVYKVVKRSRRYQAQVNGFPGYYENPRTQAEYIHSLENVKCENIQKFLLIQGQHE